MHLESRLSWAVHLAAIIALGLLSRTIHTRYPILEKYPGDALYAAMIYAILRLFSTSTSVPIWAMAIMTVLELFQLTLIPAHMLTSTHLIVRVCARLLGTQFSFLDLLAYAVGIGCMYLVDPRKTVR